MMSNISAVETNYNIYNNYHSKTIHFLTKTKIFMVLSLINFRPAQVMGIKEVYVCFYVSDPATGKLKRVRIRCNRIKDKKEQKRYANVLCAKINSMLYKGWNPFMSVKEMPNENPTITEASSFYLNKKEKELRHDTLRSYRSKLNFFQRWCEKKGISNWQCHNFTSKHAEDILNEYGTGRSAYSFNCMLQYLKGMFGHFLIEGLVSCNPFVAIKGRRKEIKHRVTIPRNDRKRILNYFLKRGMKEYIVIIRLCFKYLIRPKEILMLQISDIDFNNGILHIPPEVSKNHYGRTIALGHDVMKYFLKLKTEEMPMNTYIFSSDFKPGDKLYTTKNLFSTWKQIRKSLSMPEGYHFYSLKDTGITEMLESGMPLKFVKDLAGHHSLSMTERYMHTSDAKTILKANKIHF